MESYGPKAAPSGPLLKWMRNGLVMNYSQPIATVLFLLGLCFEASANSETPAEGEESSEPSGGYLGIMIAPYGMNYLNGGAGLQLFYKIPLVKKDEILWNTTNITFGVSDFYCYVNNNISGFIEVTPIAIFKLKAEVGYDYFIREPFDTGIQALTEDGRLALKEGNIKKGSSTAIDWVNGLDNRRFFKEGTNDGGLKLTISPTLQAKIGPVGLQYTFIADYNNYQADGLGPNDVFHDGTSFTLKQMEDWGLAHELNVVYIFNIPQNEFGAGLFARYYAVRSTQLHSLGLYLQLFYSPTWASLGQWKPWAAARLGTFLVDSMHQYDFSWVMALGTTVRLF